MPISFTFFSIALISLIINAVCMEIIRSTYKLVHEDISKDKMVFNFEALAFAYKTNKSLYLISRLTAFTWLIASLLLIPAFFFELYNLIF